MALGTTAAILTGVLLGTTTAAVASSMLGGRKVSTSGPIPLPQPPSAEAAAGKAGEVIKKKRATMTQSIYTSPLGVAGEAQGARKTLLGQ